MPRTPRIALPNYPHHVIQGGHNRQTVFPLWKFHGVPKISPNSPPFRWFQKAARRPSHRKSHNILLYAPENPKTIAILYKTTASRNNS
jgi:hypothetical protein